VSQDLKIDYIELPARDLDAVQAFYERVFGWTFQDYGPDYRAVGDAGGRVVKPIFDFPGGRRFHFTDPNGNELAVWSDRTG